MVALLEREERKKKEEREREREREEGGGALLPLSIKLGSLFRPK